MTPRQSLIAFAEEKLRGLETKNRRRRFYETVRASDGAAARNGAPVISFSCNDYLGLSHHPEVIKASQDAAARYGAGAGASRLITGGHPLYAELEDRLARLKGAEACLVFGSGYLANLGVIPALAGKGDLIVMDELSHACMHSGAQLSGATVKLFPHNNVAAAEALLQAPAAKKLLLTETVFSMDGDLAPLAALGEVAECTGAWVMTDDAHGLGIVEQDNPAPLQMGTLSKAVGVYGGYLCAPAPVIELLKSRARTVVFTTGLPPAVVAAASKSLDIIEAEPERPAAALAHARRFTNTLGLPEAQSTIVPVVIGGEQDALDAAARLEADGFLVVAIRPPTVPEGTSRLRVAFSATHKTEDVDGLIAAFQKHVLPVIEKRTVS